MTMQTSTSKRYIPWGQIVLSVFLFFGAGYLFFVDTAPVVLSWETASEVGTAGFNVYRADASTEISAEQYVQVNVDLIPAKGDEMLGADYLYEDDGVSSIKRYLYRIEEVEWNGARHLHPETVAVRAGLTRVWRQLEGGMLCALAIVMLFWGNKKK